MITTIILAFLFLLVTIAGVLSLMKGMKKLSFLDTTKACKDYVKKTQDQEKVIGGSLIGVGVVGLVMTGFMATGSGGGTPPSFGFKFY